MIRRLLQLVFPETLTVRLARSGLMSKDWLRRHPRAARAAGYVLIGGRLPL